MISDEGEIAPPPPKKQKTSSEKTVTKGAEGSAKEASAPPEGPLAPPPPKRVLKKKKDSAPDVAPAPSASQDHVSAAVVLVFFCGNPYPSSPRAYARLLAAKHWLDERLDV